MYASITMSFEAAEIMTEVIETSVPDICLVCPSGEVTGLKIFASIAVLRNESPVFHPMLGPHFLEGQHIANNPGPSFYELHLPEDNAQGMLLIVQILHVRYQEIAQAVETPDFPYERIRHTAILADKYDLCQAINSNFNLLVTQNQITDMKAKDLWHILSASYILGHRQNFKACSIKLLGCYDIAYYTLIGAGVPRESDMWISGKLTMNYPGRKHADIKRSIARGETREASRHGVDTSLARVGLHGQEDGRMRC